MTLRCRERPMATPHKQLNVRLRRLTALVRWDGGTDHAATFRLYFQVSSTRHCESIPLLLDPDGAVKHPRVISLQHTPQMLPVLPSRSEKLECRAKAAALDTERSRLHGHHASNCEVVTELAAKRFDANMDLALAGSHRTNVRTPRTPPRSQNKRLLNNGTGDATNLVPSSLKLQENRKTHEAAKGDFFYDRRGISPTRPRTPLKPVLGTINGRNVSEGEDEGESVTSLLASTSEEITSDVAVIQKMEGQSASKHRLQRSSASDTPTRIPAPVWRDIVPSRAQHQTPSCSPTTLPPDLRPSTPKAGGRHDTSSRPISPLRFSWSPNDLPPPTPLDTKPKTPIRKKKPRKSSSFEDLSPFSNRQGLDESSTNHKRKPRKSSSLEELVPFPQCQGLVETSSNRKRSQSAANDPVMSYYGSSVSFDEPPSSSESVELVGKTSDGTNSTSALMPGRRKLMAETVEQNLALAKEELLNPAHNEATTEEIPTADLAAADLVTVIRDQAGRLCVVRPGGFERGHYQIDLEFRKKPTEVDERSVQKLEMPALEPAILMGNVFHDGKMFLQITGPWTNDAMRIFPQGFLDHQLFDPNLLVGTFKSVKIPSVQIRRKGGFHYLDKPSTRVSTEVSFSTPAHNVVKVQYEASARCREKGEHDGFANHVVLEFVISNAFIKSETYVLEPETSTLELELLPSAEHLEANTTEAVITVFRNSANLKLPLKLRFSTSHGISPSTNITLASVRPTKGTLDAEEYIITKPKLPLKLIPSLPTGKFPTWTISDNDDKPKFSMTCQIPPNASPDALRKSVCFGLERLKRVTSQFSEIVLNSGKPVAVNLSYQVSPLSNMFKCVLDVHVSRKDWDQAVEIETNGWEVANSQLDGQTYSPKEEDDRQKMVEHGLWTIRRPDVETWFSLHVNMVFVMSEEAARSLYNNEKGKGFLPLPKVVDSWVACGSVEAEMECATVHVRAWPPSGPIHIEAKLIPSKPVKLEPVDPTNSMKIQYTAPITTTEPLSLNKLRRFSMSPSPSHTPPLPPEDPPSPVFSPTLQGMMTSDLESQPSPSKAKPALQTPGTTEHQTQSQQPIMDMSARLRYYGTQKAVVIHDQITRLPKDKTDAPSDKKVPAKETKLISAESRPWRAHRAGSICYNICLVILIILYVFMVFVHIGTNYLELQRSKQPFKPDSRPPSYYANHPEEVPPLRMPTPRTEPPLWTSLKAENDAKTKAAYCWGKPGCVPTADEVWEHRFDKLRETHANWPRRSSKTQTSGANREGDGVSKLTSSTDGNGGEEKEGAGSKRSAGETANEETADDERKAEEFKSEKPKLEELKSEDPISEEPKLAESKPKEPNLEDETTEILDDGTVGETEQKKSNLLDFFDRAFGWKPPIEG